MSMSKKDFVALADAIKAHNFEVKRSQELGFATVAQFGTEHLLELANFCAQQNPRFMRERWLDYIAGKCGRNGGAIGRNGGRI